MIKAHEFMCASLNGKSESIIAQIISEESRAAIYPNKRSSVRFNHGQSPSRVPYHAHRCLRIQVDPKACNSI